MEIETRMKLDMEEGRTACDVHQRTRALLSSRGLEWLRMGSGIQGPGETTPVTADRAPLLSAVR